MTTMLDAYRRAGASPVAYLDETYEIHRDRTFYAVSAVVVQSGQRDALRRKLDAVVPEGWWHTTEALRTAPGRAQTLGLLQLLPEGKATCVVACMRPLLTHDKDGERTRSWVLRHLLHELYQPRYDVRLVVLERRRTQKNRRADAITLSEARARVEGRLVACQESPAGEHLLWLPDLVCGAYRQDLLGRGQDLWGAVEEISSVVACPAPRDPG